MSGAQVQFANWFGECRRLSDLKGEVLAHNRSLRSAGTMASRRHSPLHRSKSERYGRGFLTQIT